MLICTYDNPMYMLRECWQDGELVCSYEIEGRRLVPNNLFFFGANIGDWKTGQLVGDPNALPEGIRNEYIKSRSLYGR
jgi:hypothetical protein